MSGATCPACGVAVVPGYVKCPKCHRPLPRFARNSASPVGGTAVESQGSKVSPLFALAAALVVAGGIIAFFALRKHEGTASATPVATPTEPQPSTAPVVVAPVPDPPVLAPPPVQSTIHPDQIAAALERDLKRQHLWSSVTVTGDRVDVRSQSCKEAGLKTSIDASVAAFHAAGLTRLRCVEQSGAVVFTRDL
ncbi:MAG: hypothetical protein ABI678_01490 [Kofleriaceae bacterium]